MLNVNSLLGWTHKSTPNELWLAGGNGYGSTATAKRRFTSVLRNTTQDLIYSDSVVNGAEIYVKNAGLYLLYGTDNRSGATNSMGFTINDRTTGTTNIANLDPPINTGYVNAASGFVGTVLVPAYLYPGDLINFNSQAAATSIRDVQCRIIKVDIKL